VNKKKIIDFDTFCMSQALAQAQKAFDCHEVPIGAVIADEQGFIIARAYNQVESKNTQLAHAELQVLAKATKKIKRWRLQDLTIFITLQPCAMCLSALILSRVKRIVYAARSPLFGCSLDKLDWFGLYKDALPLVQLQEDERSVELLKKFFKKQRRLKHES
jgi:tRNA(adenine34) deaminase